MCRKTFGIEDVNELLAATDAGLTRDDLFADVEVQALLSKANQSEKDARGRRRLLAREVNGAVQVRLALKFLTSLVGEASS